MTSSTTSGLFKVASMLQNYSPGRASRSFLLVPKTSAKRSSISRREHCRPTKAELPFDWILADVLGRKGPVEFVLSESARCPNCAEAISEKTLIEPQGGMEVEVGS